MTTFVVVFLSEMHVDLSLFPFGGVLVVEPDLSENGDIYHNLQASANDELRWSLTQVKISGFEDVPASPHEHHLQAEKTKLKDVLLTLKMLKCHRFVWKKDL